MASVLKREGDRIQRHRGENHVTPDTEVGVMWPQDADRLQPPEARRGRERVSWSLLDAGPQNGEGISVCCCKPPGWWELVLAVLGD